MMYLDKNTWEAEGESLTEQRHINADVVVCWCPLLCHHQAQCA